MNLDDDPNNHVPLGPKRDHDVAPWGTEEERTWMHALIAALGDFHIVAPVTDTRLNETYHDTTPFVEDLTYYLTYPPRRHNLQVYLAHMMTIIETANRHSAQPAYACIVLNLRYLGVSEQRANEGTEGPCDTTEHRAFDSHDAPGPAAALKWTAMERLLDLIDK